MKAFPRSCAAAWTLIELNVASRRGLTLPEVLLVIVTIGLLAIVFMPRKGPRSKASRIACTSHLKQVGLAHRLYAQEHGDEFVFKVLVCPTDNQRRPAASFELLRNTNISYFVALDANEEKPHSLLSGDRHINGGPLKNGYLLTLTANSLPSWTPLMHTGSGNVGLADGSAQQLDTAGLRRATTQQPSPFRLAIP
jgi:prepilin-type processing-associated H-X9-DG protein